jgi:hypothetical protein
MSDPADTLLEFIHQVGDTFGIEQFHEPEILFTPHEETTFTSLVWTEVIWIDRRMLCRLYLLPPDVEIDFSLIEYFFDMYRELEVNCFDEAFRVCILVKSWHANEFWYIRRSRAFLGLFHSQLSLAEIIEEDNHE